MLQTRPNIGIIGAGRLGTALAKQLTKAGYTVRVAGSKGATGLDLILSVLVPEAVAASVADAIAQADVVILAMPLGKYRSLDPAALDGKIMIDGMNYWAPSEGFIAEFADDARSSSEVIADYFAGAHVVKALNHIAYGELTEHSLPAASPARRASAYASDDVAAKLTVAGIINDIGFEPVDLGALKNGARFQPDTPLFNARYTAAELRQAG